MGSEGVEESNSQVKVMCRCFTLFLISGSCLIGFGEEMKEWEFAVKVNATLPSL